MKVLRFFTLLSILFVIVGCGGDNPQTETDKFDRKAMLVHWADNIIVPSYEQYLTGLNTMRESTRAFISNPNGASLTKLREDWKNAYIAWQGIAMFEIGKAEENNLHGYTNTYPTNSTKINEAMEASEVNFRLPSMRAAQGFPAIEYLIYGNSDEALINSYSEEKKKKYLDKLTDLLVSNTKVVLDDWKSNYRNYFVDQSGSSASASVNKLTNDFLFYYEKYLRAGKVGIPSGVFSSAPLADKAEAPYSGISKTLFNASLDAVQHFFNGKAANGSNAGNGYAAYLAYLESDLPTKINAQFDQSRTKSNALDESFKKQVESDNIKLLELYDALQKNVVTIKVDMLQKLNIKVDYVDADGD